MRLRIFNGFLLIVTILIGTSACSLKPRFETEKQVAPDQSTPDKIAPSDVLCVYASKLKGMAELLSSEPLSETEWQYRFRFYPGDHEFELTLNDQGLEIGQELKAVRRIRVSGPESCSIYEYRIATQPDN